MANDNDLRTMMFTGIADTQILGPSQDTIISITGHDNNNNNHNNNLLLHHNNNNIGCINGNAANNHLYDFPVMEEDEELADEMPLRRPFWNTSTTANKINTGCNNHYLQQPSQNHMMYCYDNTNDNHRLASNAAGEIIGGQSTVLLGDSCYYGSDTMLNFKDAISKTAATIKYFPNETEEDDFKNGHKVLSGDKTSPSLSPPPPGTLSSLLAKKLSKVEMTKNMTVLPTSTKGFLNDSMIQEISKELSFNNLKRCNGSNYVPTYLPIDSPPPQGYCPTSEYYSTNVNDIFGIVNQVYQSANFAFKSNGLTSSSAYNIHPHSNNNSLPTGGINLENYINVGNGLGGLGGNICINGGGGMYDLNNSTVMYTPPESLNTSYNNATPAISVTNNIQQPISRTCGFSYESPGLETECARGALNLNTCQLDSGNYELNYLRPQLRRSETPPSLDCCGYLEEKQITNPKDQKFSDPNNNNYYGFNMYPTISSTPMNQSCGGGESSYIFPQQVEKDGDINYENGGGLLNAYLFPNNLPYSCSLRNTDSPTAANHLLRNGGIPPYQLDLPNLLSPNTTVKTIQSSEEGANLGILSSLDNKNNNSVFCFTNGGGNVGNNKNTPFYENSVDSSSNYDDTNSVNYIDISATKSLKINTILTPPKILTAATNHTNKSKSKKGNKSSKTKKKLYGNHYLESEITDDGYLQQERIPGLNRHSRSSDSPVLTGNNQQQTLYSSSLNPLIGRTPVTNGCVPRPESPPMNLSSSPSELVFVWDLDETLIVFNSLLSHTFATRNQKDIQQGLQLGLVMEEMLFNFADSQFFYNDLENHNQVNINDLLAEEMADNDDLGNYDFSNDGLSNTTYDYQHNQLLKNNVNHQNSPYNLNTPSSEVYKLGPGGHVLAEFAQTTGTATNAQYNCLKTTLNDSNATQHFQMDSRMQQESSFQQHHPLHKSPSVDNNLNPYLMPPASYPDDLCGKLLVNNNCSNAVITNNTSTINGTTESNRKIALRYKKIKDLYNVYRTNIQAILGNEKSLLYERLLSEIDTFSDQWLTIARSCLSDVANKKGYVNVVVGNFQLIPTVAKILLYNLGEFFDIDNIYSSTKIGKINCFDRIYNRFGKKCTYIIIGDGSEEIDAAKQLNIPSWKINALPDLISLKQAIELDLL